MQAFINAINDFGTVIQTTVEMFVSMPYFGLALIALIIGIIERCNCR